MALWLNCGVDSDAVAQEAKARKVLVAPESNYRFAGSRPGTHLRLGYASQTPQEIRAGADLLLDAIASVRAGRDLRSSVNQPGSSVRKR
jgi:DNA-binding transcriptional MocR family regulator